MVFRQNVELLERKTLLSIPYLNKGSIMLSRLFRAHGRMCASHPWEVIITSLTVTLCLVSMSVYASHNLYKLCGWNYVCQNEEEIKSSDIIILAITRCLAVMYIYLQFRNLRRLGSKYILGIAGVFTIFSSFVFSIALINLIGSDLRGLNEALPFFLLLVDLGKASALARFTLSSSSQEEVQANIASGMAIIGPAITLDAIVETLVIGVGTLSGVKQLETMCCFGCLSVIANYLAFLTFYPACLAIILEVSRERNQGKPLKQLQQLAKILQAEEEEKKPNPVTQRVKIIMSAGLVLVHAHSRFVAEMPGKEGGGPHGLLSIDHLSDQQVKPSMPIWRFYIDRMLTVNMDYTITLVLASALIIKYILFDNEVDRQMYSLLEKERSEHNHDNKPAAHALTNGEAKMIKCDNTEIKEEKDKQDDSKTRAVTFTVGDNSSDSESGDKETEDKNTQTDFSFLSTWKEDASSSTQQIEELRDLKTCVALMESEAGAGALTDSEVVTLVNSKHIPFYKIEKMIGDYERGVQIRRQSIQGQLASSNALEKLPFTNYDYKYVDGACCENVIGYMPVPVGVAGPLLLNGKNFMVPMATTEGCLVASVNRGCTALRQSGGVTSAVYRDGMSRAPVVEFPSVTEAVDAIRWLENRDNYELVKDWFDSTSRFARLEKLTLSLCDKQVYIRFVSTTGDAMGMNMLSKGCEKALNELQAIFPNMKVISLSGNFCTDKKPAAINWVEGRGKSVVCCATIPGRIVQSVLKTTSVALVELNFKKNFQGSAMAGVLGGFNAHAANMVTAIYIATGQDPAQTIASSNCITTMWPTGPLGEDVYISCTMPSLELGTVGGGTVLPPQSACLEMLGVKGSNVDCPSENAKQLASIVCATVLAGELSLMSALAAGHLVKSHLKHNRSTLNLAPGAVPTLHHSKTAPGACINKSS
ncbi:3-hydroxy-3-methylglutaryl-coenzyme A reductase-like isoform X1 [Littorina saxatilis]|uniref:3-hydroxy-3-methylglutaryl coenzyme A reductase n=2 Tax=Littorina saxatilis TaxID=31220 RepID=A0AAN9C335_9CAEN